MNGGLQPPGLRAALLSPGARTIALLAVTALILFSRAGTGTLANYDDCYYASKAREMLRGGDWITPHFAGTVTLDNPPLFLWIIAACFAVMGVSDYAAIFGSALSGLLCVLLVRRLARRLGRSEFEGWAAAVVLLTTGYFLKYAGHAMFDVFLTLLFLLAILAYRAAWDGRWAGWLALGAFTGLGVLTKSVLGLFPLVVVVLHLAWQRRWRLLLGGPVWAALAVALLVIAPWYGAQLRIRGPQFVHEHLGWLIWQRGFVIGRGEQTLASHFAYFTEIATIYWPWLPFALTGLVLAVREAFRPGPPGPGWDDRASARLLVVWPAVVLGIMSLGIEKKLWYVMSVFPALALLGAQALGGALRSARARERFTWGSWVALACAGLALATTPWGRPAKRRPDLQMVAHAARTLVPADEPVVIGAGSFYNVAHQFVYYADRRLVDGQGDPARIRSELARGRWGLLDRTRLASAVGPDTLAYPVVVRSGEWSLVHAGPRPVVELSTRDPWE